MSFSDDQRLEFAQMMAEAIRMATPQNTGEGANRTKETSVWTNKLREFSGGDNYIDFRREIALYVMSHKKDFATDDAKIYFVLSYLKSG